MGSAKIHFAAIDGVAGAFESGGDVLRGHGAEELVVFAGFLGDGDFDRGHHLRQIGGVADFFGFAAQVGLLFLLHDLLVGIVGGYCQAFRQQVIAGVAGGDFYYVAAAAEVIDFFS